MKLSRPGGGKRSGWSSDWRSQRNEDCAPESDNSADSTFGLGSETDEAFRRGRDYRTKGYSLSTGKAAVRKKGKDYQDAFIRGWKWQDAREKQAKESRKRQRGPNI